MVLEETPRKPLEGGNPLTYARVTRGLAAALPLAWYAACVVGGAAFFTREMAADPAGFAPFAGFCLFAWVCVFFIGRAVLSSAVLSKN